MEFKQHPVKHAKGRAKLDGVLVAEVTSDTPRKTVLFEACSTYPEREGGVFGLYTSAFYAIYPECERKNFCKQLPAYFRNKASEHHSVAEMQFVTGVSRWR